MVASREGGRDLNVGSFLHPLYLEPFLFYIFLIPKYFQQRENWFGHSKSQRGMGKGHETPPVAEDPLAVDGSWWTGCIFFRDVFPERLPMLLQQCLSPMSIKAALSSLSVLITIYMCKILNKKNNKSQQKGNLFGNLIKYHEDYNFVRFRIGFCLGY